MSEEVEQAENLEQAIDDATAAVDVQTRELEELAGGSGNGAAIGIDSLLGVPVQVTVQVGRAAISLSELIELRPGSLLPLDRESHEPADILVNGRVIARGEVVTIGERYGVRISSVEKRADS